MTADRMSPPPHMCATCLGVLTPLEQEGVEGITWYHAVPAGHPATPVLAHEPEMICDFCSAPDPTWNAECTPFKTSADAVFPGIRIDGQDDGLWAACDPCASYIKRGDWPRLLYRATKAFDWPPGFERMAAHMHDQFRHHFTGVVTPR